MKKSNFKQLNAFDIFLSIFLIIFSFITIYPIWNVLVGSFNNGLDYTAGGVHFWPRKFSIDNYRVVLNDTRIWRAYFITIMRTLIGTSTSLIFVGLVAYAMSRRQLKLRGFFYYVNIFTMFFSGGFIPTFVVMKALGLFNSFWVYILPGIYSVYHMIIMQNFFRSLPSELCESAYIDGAGEYTIFFKIIIPISKPILATIALWLILGHWNTYFDSMFYVTDPKLFTLQYVLMRIINESSVPSGGIMPLPPDVFERVSPKTVSLAAIIISTIPVLLAYPFLQKHFAKGVMVGSLKG